MAFALALGRAFADVFRLGMDFALVVGFFAFARAVGLALARNLAVALVLAFSFAFALGRIFDLVAMGLLLSTHRHVPPVKRPAQGLMCYDVTAFFTTSSATSLGSASWGPPS